MGKMKVSASIDPGVISIASNLASRHGWSLSQAIEYLIANTDAEEFYQLMAQRAASDLQKYKEILDVIRDTKSDQKVGKVLLR